MIYLKNLFKILLHTHTEILNDLLYLYVWAHVWMCVLCVASACRGQEMSEALELELQVTVTLYGCWELNLGPVQDLQLLLNWAISP